jgi:hypothetical protein
MAEMPERRAASWARPLVDISLRHESRRDHVRRVAGIAENADPASTLGLDFIPTRSSGRSCAAA